MKTLTLAFVLPLVLLSFSVGNAHDAHADTSVARTAAVKTAESATGPSLLGVVFELMPAGTITGVGSDAPQGRAVSRDAAFAVGATMFLDAALSRFLALGMASRVGLRTKPEDATGLSATQVDLRVRLTARAPVSPNAHLYGRLSPGYSFIMLPQSNDVSPPIGALIDCAVGAEIGVLPRMFVVVDLGYQVGFQSPMSSRYLHIGAGLAYAF
jgi:hypothetical protein